MRSDINIKSYHAFFYNWVIPASIYISLASGAGNPIRCHESVCNFVAANLLITLSLAFVVFMLRAASVSVFPQLIGLLIGMVCVGILSIGTQFPQFVLSKIWGGGLASGFLLVLISSICLYGGIKELARGISRITIFVMLFTLLYKVSNNALFNRDVYVINGPIVFGWIMGLGALCSAFIYLQGNRKTDFFVLNLLSIGVFWSGSKGPITAYVISLLLLLISYRGFSLAKMLALLFISIGLASALFAPNFDEMLRGTRFDVILNAFDNDIDYSEGSVGVRFEALELSSSLLGEYFLKGVGPGNFAVFNPILMYPHNVHVEILLEYGILVFALYSFLIVYALATQSVLIRSVILFFLICLSFSGDVSYLRFLLPFLLIGRCTMSRSTPFNRDVAF